MDDTKGTMVGTNVVCIGVGVGVDMTEVRGAVQGVEELDRVSVVAGAQGVALIIPQDEEEGGGATLNRRGGVVHALMRGSNVALRNSTSDSDKSISHPMGGASNSDGT